MRDLFEFKPEDALASVQRGAQPALRRRFYDKVTTAAVDGGYAVRLDDKPIRTPARRVLAAPSLAIAERMAAEWQAQAEVIDPAQMPLTRLANTIIDGVVDEPGPVAAEIKKYLASDLLFYRASSPQQLRARQAQHWDPILGWARDEFGAHFELGEGVVHVAQSDAELSAAAAALPSDPWQLGAMHAVTTLTGSALVALALARGQVSIDAAWQAAHVDEDWNMEQWGRDEIALARRAARFAELQAAATVLQPSSR